MQPFLYLRRSRKKTWFPKMEEQQAGDCRMLTVTDCGKRFHRWLANRVTDKEMPVFSEFALPGIPAYRPHKKLFYQQLETVLKKAGRRMNIDFCRKDIGIVCQSGEQAAKLVPRLTAPMIWVFCKEGAFEDTGDCPVFFSREEKNIRRLAAVIALDDDPALSFLSSDAVLFNLTERDFERRFTVNDVWLNIPDELKATGVPGQIWNSILFDLDQSQKISSLRWRFY